MTGADHELHDYLRAAAPRAVAALARRHDDFAAAEDAVQEALLSAYRQWPGQGVPASPTGWLVTVATRRLLDAARSDSARRRREAVAAATDLPPPDRAASAADDTLDLLVLCCHRSLQPAAQIALTLRAVGGLTTQEIARAFLLPEPAMSKRISRAKRQILASGGRFGRPDRAALDERLPAVRHVLYLIYNEGYAAATGPDLQRPELAAEAIRLAGALHAALPADGETAGLLALMELLDARRRARVRPDGSLVPLAHQDRALWDRHRIEDATRLLASALSRAPLGPYQLHAAIAAVHAEAPTAESTDWPQIERLYELLARAWPSPVVALNHAVAAAMVRGPDEGLRRLDRLEAHPALKDHHRLHAVRAHLLEQAGDPLAAQAAYRAAARLTVSHPEQAYLLGRARELDGRTPPPEAGCPG